MTSTKCDMEGREWGGSDMWDKNGGVREKNHSSDICGENWASDRWEKRV